jgi:hypothetical protein
MGTPHIGMGRDMSIFQIGESPYQYGAHSNLGTNIHSVDAIMNTVYGLHPCRLILSNIPVDVTFEQMRE